MKMQTDDDPVEPVEEENEQPKQKSKKKKRKPQKPKLNKTDKDKDYELFLRDIEEDPDLSSQVNKYKEADVLNMLEVKMSKLTLAQAPKPKMKAKRHTAIGKQKEREFQEKKLIEANLAQAMAGEDSDIEEDFPVVKLTDLLDEMALKDED